MGISAVEKLVLSVGFEDLASSPAKKLTKEIAGLKQSFSAGFSAAKSGAMGLVGAGVALAGLIAPARDMNKAIGEVASLGTSEKELKTLEKTALEFSMKFGGSASDVVRAAYDIQSAFTNLGEGDLAKFTENSALLATATKADTATITNYMGTMAGVFGKEMAVMGNGNWVDDLTAKTAEAVRIFKTDGNKISQAFTSLGATATSAGISMSEQMAVMGTLGATMGGGEAGSKYKAFMAGVGKSQEKLGMSFTSAEGNMLPMVDILEKIKSKMGENLSVADSDFLASAFGSQEAVLTIKNLLPKIDELKKSTKGLESTKGLDGVAKMADATVDPVDKLWGSFQAVGITLSEGLTPFVMPLITGLGNLLKKVFDFMQNNPILAKTFGVIAVAIIGVVSAISAFTVVMGVIGMVKSAVLIFKSFNAVLTLGKVVMWLFNGACAANPIGLVVLAIAALVAVVAGIIYYFDEISAWFNGLPAWGKILFMLASPITALIGLVAFLSENFETIKFVFFEVVGEIWGGLKMIGGALYSLFVQPFVSAFKWISDAVPNLINKLLGWLRKIPGIGKFIPELSKDIEIAASATVESPAMPKDFSGGLSPVMDAVPKIVIEAPALTGNFNNNIETKTNHDIKLQSLETNTPISVPNVTNTSSTSQTTNWGGVQIFTGDGMSPQQMEEFALLNR